MRKRRPSTTSTAADRKSTRLNSSHLVISYAVFRLKKKNAFFTFLPGLALLARFGFGSGILAGRLVHCFQGGVHGPQSIVYLPRGLGLFLDSLCTLGTGGVRLIGLCFPRLVVVALLARGFGLGLQVFSLEVAA